MLRNNNFMKEDIKKEASQEKKNIDNKITLALLLIVLGILISGYTYLKNNENKIYVEKGQIYAPKIDLSSQDGGILEKLWVKEGDMVIRDQAIAQVGAEIIRSRQDGLITNVQDEIGKKFASGEVIASMINPDDLRLVGTVDEDNGLKDIKVGEKVVFTVDAFGQTKYQGFVDAISPASKDRLIAPKDYDKRLTGEFEIKVRFNTRDYSEFKNGMSAKLLIEKN